MKAHDISTQTGQDNMENTSFVNETHSSKPFIFGTISVFLLHYVVGFIQTPGKVIEAGLQKGITPIFIKVGYAFGIFCIYALPIPLGFSLLSLFIKSKRNALSFTTILFWCLVVTLSLSILMGFVYVPRAVRNINFNTLE